MSAHCEAWTRRNTALTMDMIYRKTSHQVLLQTCLDELPSDFITANKLAGWDLFMNVFAETQLQLFCRDFGLFFM